MFRHIEDSSRGHESEKCFVGLFDDFDVNSNQLGATVPRRNERLVKLLNGIGELNLGDINDHKEATMPRQKKDGRHINYYIDRKVFEELEEYAQEKGQTMTTALERILSQFFEQRGKENNTDED